MLLGRTIWVWELYLFSHLGLAFVLAALIGTPGCEMRAFHNLYTQVSGGRSIAGNRRDANNWLIWRARQDWQKSLLSDS
jgi:hypothetical protein